MKKLFALVLSFCLCLTMCPKVFADENENIIKNGNFINGTEPWYINKKDNTNGVVEVTNEGAQFKVTQTNGNPWELGLHQGQLVLEDGSKYILSFEAKVDSDIEKTLRVVVENQDPNWEKNLEEYVNLSNEFQKFTETAADAVANGELDGAGFARQFLADQRWITKLMNDEQDDIRPCILCHNGCFNMCHYKGVPNDQDLSDSLHLARCAVNAETMQWNKHYIKKTTSPKTVHIIGGGIGGMEAARVLKLRGHNPIIHEKSGELGGAFIAASAESYKGKLRDLLAWYIRKMDKLGIEVRLNDEIKDVSAFGKEPVIIATGAIPRLLKRVPGYEKMVEACEYLRGSKGVGQTVAVIGGGLTGSEIAYELALQGKNPVIVEMKDDLISQKGVCLANSSYLREWFELHKVPVYLETTLKEVKDGAIVCTGKDGKDIEIKCDSVISCAGYIPAPVAEKGGKRHLVGDCDKVGNLRTVVWNAYETAMKI